MTEEAAEAKEAPARLLVTGASGFIGLALLQRLTGSQVPVRVLAMPGTQDAFSRLPDVEVVEGNIAVDDGECLDRALEGVEVIYHLAGITDSSDGNLSSVNVDGTRRLLEAAERAGLLRRFVFVSSVAVYTVASFFRPGKWPIGETGALQPVGERLDYGRSKVAAESLVREHSSRSGFEYVILRPTVCYSATSGTFQWMVGLLLTKRLPATVNRKQPRQLIHVDDLADVLVSAGSMKGAANNIFNVAGEEASSIDDLERLVRECQEPDPGVGRPPSAAAPALAAPLKYDITKARRDLGFVSGTSLREEVQKVVAQASSSGVESLMTRPPTGAGPLPGLKGAGANPLVAESRQDWLGGGKRAGGWLSQMANRQAPQQRSPAHRGFDTSTPGLRSGSVIPSPHRPLKVGLLLPMLERPGGGVHWNEISAMARLAEDVGMDSLWAADHLVFKAAEQTAQSWQFGHWDCWSMLSALAAVTQRVELGTLVICTNFRNPALLAKMADTVDEISAGRLILGLGAGYHEEEFRAFGYPHDKLVGRFEEALTVIATLLRERKMDFEGQYYSARECELRPQGPRRRGPPILIGATGKRMLRLTAEFADLWNAWFVYEGGGPEQLVERSLAVDAACEKAGRDPGTLGRTVAVRAAPETGPAQGLMNRMRQGKASLSGSPGAFAEGLKAFADAGVSHLQVVLTPASAQQIEALGRALEELDRYSAPALVQEPGP